MGKWPLPEPKPSRERVMALAMLDSKRGITSESNDEISDVLLHRMGDVVPTKTSMLSKFPSRYVLEWLCAMGFPSEEHGTKQIENVEFSCSAQLAAFSGA